MGRADLGPCLGQGEGSRIQLGFRLAQHGLRHVQLRLLVRNELPVGADLGKPLIDHSHSRIILIQKCKLGSQRCLGKLELRQLLQIRTVRN